MIYRTSGFVDVSLFMVYISNLHLGWFSMFASKAIQARRIKEYSNVITIIHDTVSAAIRYALESAYI